MLTEDYGIVYKATAATPTPSGIVLKLKDIFAAPASYWEEDVAVSATGYLLIKAKYQDWGVLGKTLPAGLDDPNSQQILFHATAQNLYITYAPTGGIDGTNYTSTWTPGFTVGVPGVLTTGRRPITGNATANLDSSRITGQFYFTEYRDQSRRTNLPASAILLAFQSSDKPTRWLVGAHVGSILRPDNRNDALSTAQYGYKLTGDGIMVGAMTDYDGATAVTSDGMHSWVRSEYSSNPALADEKTAFRIGDTWYNFDTVGGNTATDLDHSAAYDDAINSNLNGSRRMFPYNFYYIRSIHLGTTKYLRFTNTRFRTDSPTIMESLTPGSSQAWAGWSDYNWDNGTYPSQSNCAILWNKTVIDVP